MEQQLKNLIKSLAINYPQIISEKELFTLLSKDLVENLISLGILKLSTSDNFVKCPSCGSQHEAFYIKDKFMVNCDNAEFAGVYSIQKEELTKYALNLPSIMQDLSKALQLEIDIKQLDNKAKAWNLGIKKYKGEDYTFLFFRDESYRSAVDLLGQLSKKVNPIILYLGDEKIMENTDTRIICIESLIRLTGNKINWNTSKIDALFVKDSMANAEDLKLSRNVLIRKQGNKFKILFNQLSNGAYEFEDKLSPSQYYLLWHLAKLLLGKTRNKSKTAKELASSLNTKSNKYILKMINQLNELSQKYIQDDLILSQPEHKYIINSTL